MNTAQARPRPRAMPLPDALLSRSTAQPSGCRTWDGCLTKKGHGQIGVKGKMLRTHRLAFEIWKGSIPDGMHVLHRCDNPACINPDHLFLGTNRDNVADMVSKARHMHGERHHAARLTEADVLAIRASAKSHAALAREFGVAEVTIRDARTGRKWAHISPVQGEAND
jgi:hypothetical protein